MDGSRFDAWTRRRFGLAAGGLAASVLGLIAFEEGTAKKKCKRLAQSCKPNAKDPKKRCCKGKGLKCGKSVQVPDGKVCCHRAQGTCADASECCAPSLCDVAEGKCCILVSEGPCKESADCCELGVCNPDTKVCDPAP